jgi:RNA polymerase subunit RPABC4/transcription elongation factor Spt4
MSLKPCKECGNEVSTKANSCPKCGAVTRRGSSLTTGSWGGDFIVLIVVVAIIAAITGNL